ncbi:MAG: HD domain-containing protein, partial [Actinobacteria bacterium]
LYKNKPVGVLHREDITGIKNVEKEKKYIDISNTVLRKIIDCFPNILVILDKNQNIIYYNKQALNILHKRQPCIKGKKFEWVFGNLFGKNHKEFLLRCPANRVIETWSPVNDMEIKTIKGHTYVVNYYPIVHQKSLKYIVINMRDITHKKTRENDIHTAYEELSRAFRLMLPSTKIEKLLKAIPEYRDHFDHNTGLVKIIEIIPDGTYRHVINCLKIASELQEKGIFNMPGVDRNTIVQALTTHDTGKKQPQLNVGDIIDPKTCFTEGKVHAMESAKIISKFPFISSDVINLVQFHHHAENELPDDFPARLLPMLRLLKLIDGLSAGLTRKNSKLSSVVEGSKIIVLEKNSHPHYNGIK